MKTEKIQTMLINVLADKLGVEQAKLIPSNWDAPLTGPLVRLKGTDLVYLLFELEDALGIRIRPDCFKNYAFNSINSITNAICSQME